MFKKIKRVFKRLFKKIFRRGVKPRNPKEIELVADGFVPASDFLCYKYKDN